MKYKKLSLLIASLFITGYAYSEEVEVKPTDLNLPDKPLVETKGSTNIKLDDVVVKERPPVSVKYQLPNTVEVNKAEHIMETVNILDTEDALKYMPSLFVRKRNYGDTQPVLATRTWGLNSSARSLVYADDVLLTALIGNDNNYGSPRWGMVAPEEIERIDVLYGPYSAQYSGNSMGAVVNITTRMPEKFEGSVTQTIANQSFSLYGVNKDLLTSKTSAIFGDKINDFSFWASVDHEDSHSQPLGWITATSQPSNTLGGYSAVNKLGQVANVYIAGGLQHSDMDNLKAKIAYDITPTLKATYTFGYWSNDAQQRTQTFLTSTTSGQSTFGGLSVGSYFNNVDQQHTMHSVTLKSDTQETFDWELVTSFYNYDHDRKQSPLASSTTDQSFIASKTYLGANQVMDGTGWSSYDFKGIWRPDGKSGNHEVSFGLHRNDEELSNLTYNNTSAWDVDAQGNLSSAAKGKTSTDAIWIQDAWKFMPNLKATVGGRFEHWTADSGYNFSGVFNTNGTYNTTNTSSPATTSVNQPSLSSTDFSPKTSLSWDASNDWRVTGSVGQATRYPTVIELYQLVTVGTALTNPNPNLKPEDVFSGELAFEKIIPDGKARVSLFNENVHNALISQTNDVIVNNLHTAVSYVNNVDKVRNRGIELAYQQDHFMVSPLEIQASLTYVDSRILKDSNWKPASTNPAPLVNDITDKHAPYVPMWRATVLATWRSSENLSTSLGLRYSGKQYSTLDNIDNGTNVMGGFDSFFVADIKSQYKFDKHWTGSVGVDNLFNEKYTLYHPFPQRTAVATLKYNF